MGAQKKYNIVTKDGTELVKTLAPPTNQNMVQMLQVFGVKNFSQLLSRERMLDSIIMKLDLGVDLDKFRRALDVCLIEGSDGINLEQIDLRITDGIVQDFFDQRSTSLIERTNSST